MTARSGPRAAACALGLLAATLAGAPAHGDGACRPLPPESLALDLRVASFRLDNGLRVYLAPRETLPTVAVRVVYDVGARDEPPGRSGLAHLFEHLMFKGSPGIPDGGHFRAIRDVGGRTDAMTDYDHTAYWNEVPAAHLERVLVLEADRMRGVRIDAASLRNQREAIAEERALRIDNAPYVGVAAAFLEDAWRGTPYGHSPIGTDADLAAVTLGEARRFHHRHYAPGNAVLVIAGAVDPARARHLVERHFGPVPAGPEPRERAAFAVDRSGLDETRTDPLAPFPLYAMVWHTVGASHPDRHAVAVLDDLLLGHDGARLARRLRPGLVFEAYSLSFAFRDVGLLNFVFAPRIHASFAEIRRAVREEARDLREHGPGEAELCRSVKREQVALLAALETNGDLAAAVAQGALVHGEPLQVADEVAALGRLDREAVRRSAERYLVDDWLTLEIAPQGMVRWIKAVLEVLPAGVGAALEESLL